ncbi:MAG: DUF2460 domain-containing protein [Pseudomonadota bacterium]
MSAFHEIQFPTAIALGASGGPERRTEIVTLASGHEERNQRWAHSRRRYNAGYGLKSLADVHAVITFFEERRGRLHGFRFKDPFDHQSASPGTPIAATDQLQVLDNGSTTFQLICTYGTGASRYTRQIRKPAAGSLLVAEDSVMLAEGVDFSVDTITGVVSRIGATWQVAKPVTAGFRFDTPVRFDTDALSIDLGTFNAGAVPDIPLVEVRV